MICTLFTGQAVRRVYGGCIINCTERKEQKKGGPDYETSGI